MEITSSPVRLTYQDLLDLPEDGLRHELIDGEHYVTPAPNTKHQRVVTNLGWLVRGYLEEHPIGEVFASPLDIVLSKFDVVEPDLLYISRGRPESLPCRKRRSPTLPPARSLGRPRTRPFRPAD